MFGIPTITKLTIGSLNSNVNGLLSGYQWASNSVSYGFTDNFTNDYESGYPGVALHTASFSALNSSQRSAMIAWANQYNSVSNLNLFELTGASDRDATIRIAISDAPPPITTAYAYLPGNSPFGESGDIFFNPQDYNTPVVGNYAYDTFGHELGHSLGLKHGHEVWGITNTAMDADRDSKEFSIMTYRSYVGTQTIDYATVESNGFAQSLMMYDIRAIQQMYGANFTSNATNTIYSFSTITGEMFINGVGQGTPVANRIFRTIWDGNGNDTYDFSNYTTNLSVDLTPGSWSDLDTSGNFQSVNLNAFNTPVYGNDGKLLYANNDPVKNVYARGQVFNALQYNGDVRSLIENANGGSGNDQIIGNDANNILQGNGGNDTLNGGLGADTLIGGTGNDTYIVDNINDVVTETSTLATEIDTVQSSATSYTLSANIENLTLIGTASINGIGNTLNNIIIGNSGSNLLDGGLGVDTMIGGSGNDTYIVDNVGDVVSENIGEGTDTVQVLGGSIDYTLGVNVENLIMTGAGIFKGVGNALDNIIIGNGNDNILEGGAGNDTLNGGSGKDTLMGSTGNDTLDGGTGNDTLIGGAGNDTYVVDNAGDVITESIDEGTDTVQASFTYSLGTNLENLTLLGTDNIMAIGNSSNNTISGNSGNNVIRDYAGGNDLLLGGAGNDDLYAGIGNDTLDGGAGDDLYYLSAVSTDLTNDTIVGETATGGNDTAYAIFSVGALADNVENLILGGTDSISAIGNSSNNTIYGNSGNNLINGKAGSDTLYGGAGKDTFVFDKTIFLNQIIFGVDTISDFNTNDDKIQLSKLAFSSTNLTTAAGISLLSSDFSVVSNDAAALNATTAIVYASSTGHLFYNADTLLGSFGTDGGQFASITSGLNASTLTSSSFNMVA